MIGWQSQASAHLLWIREANNRILWEKLKLKKFLFVYIWIKLKFTAGFNIHIWFFSLSFASLLRISNIASSPIPFSLVWINIEKLNGPTCHFLLVDFLLADFHSCWLPKNAAKVHFSHWGAVQLRIAIANSLEDGISKRSCCNDILGDDVAQNRSQAPLQYCAPGHSSKTFRFCARALLVREEEPISIPQLLELLTNDLGKERANHPPVFALLRKSTCVRINVIRVPVNCNQSVPGACVDCCGSLLVCWTCSKNSLNKFLRSSGWF